MYAGYLSGDLNPKENDYSEGKWNMWVMQRHVLVEYLSKEQDVSLCFLLVVLYWVSIDLFSENIFCSSCVLLCKSVYFCVCLCDALSVYLYVSESISYVCVSLCSCMPWSSHVCVSACLWAFLIQGKSWNLIVCTCGGLLSVWNKVSFKKKQKKKVGLGGQLSCLQLQTAIPSPLPLLKPMPFSLDSQE